jgi:tRNA(Ile2) C34 agmatinyltransferase TiaS
MSMTPTCPRCDARVDAHGRDGSHTFCLRCRDETGFGIDCGKVEREQFVEVEHLGPGRIAA